MKKFRVSPKLSRRRVTASSRFRKIHASTKFSNFDDFYQACWDKLLEDWHKRNPEGDVDQNTQGGEGSTELWADGFGGGYYFNIWESDALKNCEKAYNEDPTDLEAGVDAIYDAGYEKENPDWVDEDGDWDDEDW